MIPPIQETDVIDLGQYEALADKQVSSEEAKEKVFEAHKKRMANLLAELDAEEKEVVK